MLRSLVAHEFLASLEMSNRGDNRPAAGDTKQDDAPVQQISDSVSRIAIGEGNQRQELIVDDEGQVLQEVEDDDGRGEARECWRCMRWRMCE
jgi:hypothetical protein